MTKPFHAGRAAESGVLAAELAGHGWSAAPTILEADRGFFRAAGGGFDPGAIEGKDYRPENVMALWDITIREDIWIVENNHLGVMSRAYGPGRYATHEDYPAGFIKWYMTEVVKA